MHHKTREFPLGETLAFFLLLSLAVTLLYGLFAITGPVPAAANTASTAMLQPAISAAPQLRQTRPVWDGYHPGRYTGPHPMCPASSYRLHRWARGDQRSPWFRVECLPIGDGWYAWEGIAP